MGRKQQTPTLEIPKDSTNGIYYIFFTGPKWSPAQQRMVTKPQRESTGHTDFKLAFDYMNGWLQGEKEREKNKTRLTVRAGVDYYIDQQVDVHCTPDSAADVKRRLNAFCGWFGWDRFVDELAKDDLTNYIKERRKDRGYRGTRKKDYSIWSDIAAFRTMRNFCRDNGKLSADGLLKFKIPERTVDASVVKYFTRDEAARLMTAAEDYGRCKATRFTPIYRWLIIALGTGRRAEAIESLKWSSVDMVKRTIDFRRPDQPETKKRRGTIPISDWLWPFMEAFYNDRLKLHLPGQDFVLDTPTAMYHAFKGVAVRAGLPDAHPHMTRHTFGTWMVQDGADPKAVADAMCVSVAVACKYYFHGSHTHQKKVLEQFGPKPGFGKVRVKRADLKLVGATA
jgi:integrase